MPVTGEDRAIGPGEHGPIFADGESEACVVDEAVMAAEGKVLERRRAAVGPMLEPSAAYPKATGTLPGFHLIEHPIDGYCISATGSPASRASMAARRSSPVTGTPEPGRDESNRPR